MPIPIKEYPKMLYPAGEGDPVVVNNSSEEEKARDKGFVMFHEIGESGDVVEIPDEIAAMDKEALVAFAWEKLGLNLDKRRALDTLKEQVARAMAGIA